MAVSLESLRESVALSDTAGCPQAALDLLIDFDQAIQGDATLLSTKGDLGLRLLKLDIAQLAYLQALTLGPDDISRHFKLAMLYRDLGATEVSLKHWLRICDLSPNFYEAKFSAGLLYAMNGWFDRSVDMFELIPNSTDGFWLAEIEKARRMLAASHNFISTHNESLAGDAVAFIRHLVHVGFLERARCAVEGLKVEDCILAYLKFLITWREFSLEPAVEQLAAFVALGHSDMNLSFILADGLMRLNQPHRAAEVIAQFDLLSVAPHQQELAFRINFARGAAWLPNALNLAEAMIAQRPMDSKPPQLALTLLLSTGRIGQLFGTGRASSMPSQIPGTIFQFWYDEDVPKDVAQVMSTWRGSADNSPRLVLFNDRLAKEFLAQHCEYEYRTAYEKCHHAAMKSDFIRLCYLFKYGGVYVDVDEECRGEPIDIVCYLRHSNLVAPLSTGVPRYFNNNLIASTAGHPVIKSALDEVVPILLQSGIKNIWETTGPGLLTRSIVRHIINREDAEVGVAAMSDGYFRSLCAPRHGLEYKSKPEGNWRLV